MRCLLVKFCQHEQKKVPSDKLCRKKVGPLAWCRPGSLGYQLKDIAGDCTVLVEH